MSLSVCSRSNAAMCFEAGTVEDTGGGNSCSGGGVVVPDEELDKKKKKRKGINTRLKLYC